MTLKDHIQRKNKRVLELNKIIDDAQRELEQLLSPEKTAYQEPSFDLYAEITNLLTEHPAGLSADSIKRSIAASHPETPVDPQKIMSAINYLKRLKKVVGAGYAKYKLASNATEQPEIVPPQQLG